MTKKNTASWGCQNRTVADPKAACLAGRGETVMKPPLLLHSCCGPCSTAVIERLVCDYDLTVFFYNPCITDREEYERRKEAQIAFIEKYNLYLGGMHKISLIEGEYEPDRYYELTASYSNEPEGGARCTRCFALRLSYTARRAKAEGFGWFGTTLSVSPHKDAARINALGEKIAADTGVRWLYADFKKQNGYLRSTELARQYRLYRQNYCGCIFSDWTRS